MEELARQLVAGMAGAGKLRRAVKGPARKAQSIESCGCWGPEGAKERQRPIGYLAPRRLPQQQPGGEGRVSRSAPKVLSVGRRPDRLGRIEPERRRGTGELSPRALRPQLLKVLGEL